MNLINSDGEGSEDFNQKCKTKTRDESFYHPSELMGQNTSTLESQNCWVGISRGSSEKCGLGEPLRCGEAARSWGATALRRSPPLKQVAWFPPLAVAVRLWRSRRVPGGRSPPLKQVACLPLRIHHSPQRREPPHGGGFTKWSNFSREGKRRKQGEKRFLTHEGKPRIVYLVDY